MQANHQSPVPEWSTDASLSSPWSAWGRRTGRPSLSIKSSDKIYSHCNDLATLHLVWKCGHMMSNKWSNSRTRRPDIISPITSKGNVNIIHENKEIKEKMKQDVILEGCDIMHANEEKL